MNSDWIGRTVAIVAVLGLALLAFELALPRDFVTGTNGAGSQGPVVDVAAGQRLCFEQLAVPAGTRRLRLRDGQAGAPVIFDVAPGTHDVCVSPARAVTLAGRPGSESDETPPTLDGRALDARIEIVFLPAAGERRSLLAQLPAIARRASLFRPAWAGAWTYWALLLVVWPGLALAGVLLVLRPPARRLALAVGAIAFSLSASWALLNPAFNAPDETEHFAIAQSIAERGRAPDRYPPGARGAFSSEQRLAWEHLDLAGFLGQREGRPPWDPALERRWRALEARGPPRDDGGGAQVGSAYSPLYYAALAPAYKLAGGSVFARLTAMRLFSAVLFGLLVAAVVLLVLELGAPRRAAAAAGLLVAFQPMATFIGASVNNDAAVNATAAGLLWLAVRALRRGLSPGLAAGIGALVIVAIYSKGSGAFLVPAVAVAVVVSLRAIPGSRRAAGLSLAGAAIAATLACASLAVALDHTAWPLEPARVAAAGSSFPTSPGPVVQTGQALEHPLAYATHLWQLLLPPLPGMEDLRPPDFQHPGYTIYVKRGWGSFGFAAIQFPGWVYALIALTMAGVGLLALRAARLERVRLRERAWPAAALGLAATTVVLGAEAVWFSPDQRATLGSYGRYAFPALAPAAALVAFASFGAGRRAAPAVLAALVTAMIALQLAAVWLNVSALYT